MMSAPASFLLRLAAAAAVAVTDSAAAFPVPAAPPAWSWDTLGAMAFAHVCQPTAFDASQLAELRRYPFVQFDKQMNTQSMPHASQEERFIAAARQVKAVNPDVKVLLYLNGLINFPAFRLFNATPPALLLRSNASSSGELIHLLPPGKDGGVFDVRQPAMRKLFVADCAFAMASGAVDGVFIDRANWSEKCKAGQKGFDAPTCASLPAAQRLLLEEITAALGPGAMVLAKDTGGAPMNDWEVANTVMTSDTFCSSYCHGCGSNASAAPPWTSALRDDCIQSIETIANTSARGQISQSHAMGPMEDERQREWGIACFLIGAGNHSYFSYADWGHNSWTTAGTRYWPEYERRLGAPLDPPLARAAAEEEGGGGGGGAASQFVYTRRFSSGATVTVDVDKHTAKIEWAEAGSSSGSP
jgi:hypothetical protein